MDERSMRWLIALLVCGLALALAGEAAAQAGEPPTAEAARPGYVCPPAVQLRHPERCPDAGPGAGLARLAVQGLYPRRPLPVAPANPSLGYVPFSYLRAAGERVDVFPSAEAAASGSGANEHVGRGFVFFSYPEAQEVGGRTVYPAVRGYVRSDEVARVSAPTFQGLALTRTPDRPFGWVISGGACSERTPGEPVDPSGRCYMRYEIVQVYDTVRIDEWDWFMIGPDEWMEQRMLALVFPDPTPPEGLEGDRWISVNLYEQTVAAYLAGEMVYATLASTGQHGTWTQPGVFQVWARLQRDNMSGGLPETNYYYLENVPWVLYYDNARALHGTYWHNRFGVPTSRGCVNLSIADARWFYEFAQEGTTVHVFDPSGNTPTDPALYGAGGA